MRAARVATLAPIASLALCACRSPAPAATRPPAILTGRLAVPDGSLLAYDLVGDGPVVVFLHGGFGDRRMWDEQFPALAGAYRLVRYDQRGFGRSSAPAGPYSPADDLRRLLDHVGARVAHLVGNSMGGQVALDFALLHPDRVLSVTLVASGPRGVPVPEADQAATVEVFRAAATEGLDAAAERWARHPMVAATAGDPVQGPLLRRMVRDNRAIFRMRHWPDDRLVPAAARRLDEVRAPVLVVVGSRDTPFVRWWADLAARGIAGAHAVTLDGADHMPQMIRAAEFNRALVGFLRRAPRRSARYISRRGRRSRRWARRSAGSGRRRRRCWWRCCRSA